MTPDDPDLMKIHRPDIACALHFEKPNAHTPPTQSIQQQSEFQLVMLATPQLPTPASPLPSGARPRDERAPSPIPSRVCQ